MSILVICPGCNTRFKVNDKFAGKQGPCPKCKVVIKIPSPDEVQIHVPEEFAAAGTDSKGQPTAKPIARREARVQPIVAALVGAGAVVVLTTAWLLADVLAQHMLLLGAGLLAISVPLAVGGYLLMRDDELEPYRGRALWMRGALCGVAYCALWGLFAVLPIPDMVVGNPWNWLFVGPPFVAVGGLAALALLDFDFLTGCLHYGFFLLVTLLLRFVVGLPPLWNLEVPLA